MTNLTKFETEYQQLMSLRSNFLHYLSLCKKFDLKSFDLCHFSHFTGGSIKDIFFRIKLKLVSFRYDVHDLPVQYCVNCSIKIQRTKVSLYRDLNVNGNFVNHDKLIEWYNFSSFRKGLFRGFSDNPKLDHTSWEIWPK